MTTIYITSAETVSGKTALCVGLGRRFAREGHKVGYIKPVSATARRLAGRTVDEDAQFARDALGSTDPIEIVSPVPITQDRISEILGDADIAAYERALMDAYHQVSSTHDVIILEGGSSLRQGYIVGLPTPHVSDLLDAPELVAIKYTDPIQVIDDALASKKRLGDSMLGVVLNVVPRQQLEYAQTVVAKALSKRGVFVYAVLPQDRLLMSISVRELSEALSGEILCCQRAADELVENLMVGAMNVDSALTYFRRKPNKAVITGGDRPDIQLAALETSTKCVILTGNIQPSPIILGRAEEVGVPMIMVRQDTFSAVEVIEQVFSRARFRQEKKIQRFEKMLDDMFDFEALYRAIGLTK
jgi:hypothetical protein